MRSHKECLKKLKETHLPPPPCSDERAVTPPPDADTRKKLILTRYTHAHQVPHVEHMQMAKLEALARRRRAVLCLSVYESASEVNRSGGDMQVISCHRYLAVFHPLVEQLINRLPYIWTCSDVVFYLPSPRPRSPCHHAMAS